MILQRRLPLVLHVRFAQRTILRATAWALVVYAAYAYLELHFLAIPFLPIATIGTAVAFYSGFKNSQAYDRFWEGRKIWGGIVNASRTWTTQVLSYVDGGQPEDGGAVRTELIHRHLAYINALRMQLRKTSRFFDKPAPATEERLKRHAEHMRNDWNKELAPFLSEEELAAVTPKVNPATHLMNQQGARPAQLKAEGRLDLFHQIALMDTVREFYALQGKAERIKATPFPRQYAEFGRAFVQVFVVLVPLGLLQVFAGHIEAAAASGTKWVWALPMVVSSALVSWVFVSMEAIGDASEDPFERSMNDVPMNALCRVIERDLRQLNGEAEIPEPEPSIEMLLY